MKPLYSTAELRKAVRELFSKANKNRRRVACVAYVGADALNFVPYAEGVEVYCWPQPGGTSPLGINRLLDAGAKVRFVDRLHTKVYWVDGVGCLVGSANLSSNALDDGGLKEFGVFIPESDAVDINRLLSGLATRAVTRTELDELHRAAALRAPRAGGARGRNSPVSFDEWLKHPNPQPWKFCWSDGDQDPPQSLRDEIDERYGFGTFWDWSHAREGEYAPGDWLLSFDLSDKSYMQWMFVTDVVRKPPADPEVADYPLSALQIGPLPAQPPFRLTPKFRTAFRRALRGFGVERVRNSTSSTISPAFLKRLRQVWSG